MNVWHTVMYLCSWNGSFMYHSTAADVVGKATLYCGLFLPLVAWGLSTGRFPFCMSGTSWMLPSLHSFGFWLCFYMLVSKWAAIRLVNCAKIRRQLHELCKCTHQHNATVELRTKFCHHADWKQIWTPFVFCSTCCLSALCFL